MFRPASRAGGPARRRLESSASFDDQDRAFLDLVAGQLGTAIANAARMRKSGGAPKRSPRSIVRKRRSSRTSAHEFRTPLTLISAPSKTCSPKARLAPLPTRTAGARHRNGLRLLKLVNGLLDFSRIEAGRIQAVYQPTDLAAFTAELASAFRSTIETAGL